jgi:hypothetical protein
MPEETEASEFGRARFQTWLHIHPSVKPIVYQRVFEAPEIGNFSYWLEIFFSAGIATFGLVQSSPAVIIGASSFLH